MIVDHQVTPIGERVRSWRKFKGLSQRTVASRMGVSPVALSKIESGSTDVSLSRLDQISIIFGLPLTELFETGAFAEDTDEMQRLTKKLLDKEKEITVLRLKIDAIYDLLKKSS